MIRGGFKRGDSENSMKFHYNSVNLIKITKTEEISDFVKRQQRNYSAHLARTSNSRPTKQLMYNADKYRKRGQQNPELYKQVLQNMGLTSDEFLNRAANREF